MDSHDAQGQGLKDLSIKPTLPEGAQALTENEAAHLSNTNLNGINGAESPLDAKPQVTDINLPTPTDSAADASVPTTGLNGDVATAVPADPPATAESSLIGAPADPAVQQPLSESREPVEPATEQQVAEIKAQKELADEAKDSELAHGVGDGTNVPVERQPTPPLGTTSEPMDTSGAEPSSDAVHLPHRSPVPTANGDLQEKTSEPAPAPAPSVETPVEPAKPVLSLSAEPAAPVLSTTEAKTDAPTTPAALPPTHDVEMKDAPSSPGKLSRTREDDGDMDEPEAKRMRPSSAGEPTSAVAASAGSPANIGSPASPAAPLSDRDFHSPITEPQQKAIATVIANTKRSTHSTAFAKPVDHVSLNIPTYPEIVKEPMDLGTMNDKIKARQYSTVQAFIDDFNLIIGNCEKFNGPNHAVTQNGYKLRETFEKQMSKVPGADYVEPPPQEKKKKTPAPRPSGSRRESRAAAAPKPAAASPAAPTFALGPEGVPLIRRDSGAQDGRPRREIHPPAPKDLPYSQRPKKKKYQVELRYCNEVLKEFEKPKYANIAGPFKQPVDPVALNIPNYHKIIKKPMDLSTIRKKLDGGMYDNAKEFEQDVRLMFQNCYKFNPEGDFVNICGKQFEGEFEVIWAEKDAWVKKRQQDAGVQSPGSSPEAESEEEVESEEEEDDENVDKIAALQAQIQAMSQQLNTLQGAPPPKKKKKATPPAAGKKKGTKKETKKTAKKDGEKKSSKKGKKSDAVPFVSYNEKQDISNRINTLPENRMAQALNIIRDNMPNLKGVQEDELELDIDELSNEVLYKLLQFVKKYAPKPDDEPSESRRQSFAPTQSAKPKKNKPMGAREQENRIQELRRLQAGGANTDGQGNAESSDDDDDSDEESEED